MACCAKEGISEGKELKSFLCACQQLRYVKKVAGDVLTDGEIRRRKLQWFDQHLSALE